MCAERCYRDIDSDLSCQILRRRAKDSAHSNFSSRYCKKASMSYSLSLLSTCALAMIVRDYRRVVDGSLFLHMCVSHSLCCQIRHIMGQALSMQRFDFARALQGS